jgi:ectoine hydroxylase-related dioxygenase (phytanoyl-CoA dioxygenase family)
VVGIVGGASVTLSLEHQADGGWHLPFEEYPLESSVPCLTKAGDVLFFSYLTTHGSGVNVSDEARTTLLVQMRDPNDSPVNQEHQSRGQGMMLRGIDPLTMMKP